MPLILVSVFGSDMLSNEVQLQNVSDSMVVTVDGIDTEIKAELMNAFDDIDVTVYVFELKTTVSGISISPL